MVSGIIFYVMNMMYKGGMGMSDKKRRVNYLASLIGTVAMVVMSIAAVLVFPVCILNEYLSAEYTGHVIIISMGIIALIGSVIAGALGRDGAGEQIMVSICAYYLLPVFAGIFFFEGFTMSMLYGAIACAVGGTGGWLLLMKRKTTLSKRKKRRANR